MFMHYDNTKALETKCSQITDREVISALREAMTHSYYGVNMPNPTIDALSVDDIKAIKQDIAQKKMGLVSPQSSLRSDSRRFTTIMSHLESYKYNTAGI